MTGIQSPSAHDPRRRAIALSLLGGAMLSLLPSHRGRAEAPPAALNFCFADNLPPFSALDDQGRPSGLGIDLVNYILGFLGRQQNAHLLPWARAQVMIREGKCDAIVTLATQERREYMVFSDQPLVPTRPGVWHRADDVRTVGARGMADLKGLRQGNYLGNGLAREVLGDTPVSWAPNPETALHMLQAGHTDVLLHAGSFFDLVVRHLGLMGQLAFTPLPDVPCPPFTIGIRRDFPDATTLIDQINAIISTNRATIDALVARYSSDPA